MGKKFALAVTRESKSKNIGVTLLPTKCTTNNCTCVSQRKTFAQFRYTLFYKKTYLFTFSKSSSYFNFVSFFLHFLCSINCFYIAKNKELLSSLNSFFKARTDCPVETMLPRTRRVSDRGLDNNSLKEIRTSRVCLALQTIWSYFTLINIKLRYAHVHQYPIETK